LRELDLNNTPTLNHQFSSKETDFKNLKPLTMKKVIYILMFVLLSGATFSSCTEEEIAPTTELNGGGTAMDPK
jgi:hypothetical protein